MDNLLLSLLSVQDQERFLQDCDLVDLETRQVLIETDERIEYAFFPTRGLVSQVIVLSDGNSIEFGMIGNDGFIGLSAYSGIELSPARFIVQLPGEAWRIASTKLREWTVELPRLQSLLTRYNDFLMAVAGQSAACNQLHSVTQRTARWLLRVLDRIEGDEFPLTQELLAQMLGVRRASVSLAASVLQEAGLIRYAYGRVTVLDRQGLEAVACECAAVIRRRYETLFASLLG
jgi:CRP-like cAMP-binding protein